MSRSRRRGAAHEEHSYWQSYSDMMAGKPDCFEDAEIYWLTASPWLSPEKIRALHSLPGKNRR